MKPTIIVSIKSHLDHNPVQEGLVEVVKHFGAELVDEFEQGTAEANIAVTNSVTTALRWVGETKQTSIVIAYYEDEQEKIAAFAEFFSDRVSTVPFVGTSADDEMQITSFLRKLIAEKKAEKEGR